MNADGSEKEFNQTGFIPLPNIPLPQWPAESAG
jgi:hypothetical protein